jgi:hypothetical protein
LFVPVCQAIQHAHQKGIIHRDVKPSNVLVTLYDGKPVPKVIDFGVAKAIAQRLTERTLITQPGQVVGTLEYMSPEQAELNILDIDTRSDIYSLGVLLYELLTGSTPLEMHGLRSAGLIEMLRMIREEEPPKPSTRLSKSRETLPSISAQHKTVPAKLAKLVSGDLDWITMKALEKDRTRRYETANGLARDIQRYLADEVVEARPPSVGYQVSKFVRRHKGQVIAASLMLVAILLLGIAGVLYRAYSAASSSAEEAGKRLGDMRGELGQSLQDSEQAKAEQAKQQERADREEYAAQMHRVQRAYEANNLGHVRELLEAQVPQAPGATNYRGFEWYYWYRLSHRELLTLKAPKGAVRHVVFSPDGRWLVSAGSGQVQVCDRANGQPLRTLQGEAVSPDGRWLAKAELGDTVRVWDAATGPEVHTLSRDLRGFISGPPSLLVFSPNSKRLAA